MKSSLLIFNSIILFVFILMGNTLAQTHSIDGEYIKEWLVLGPFLPDNLEMDFLADVGGEVNIEPQEGDTVTTVQGDTLAWQRYTTKSNIVNLLDAVGYHENATAYAFGVLQTPTHDFVLAQSETAGDAEIRFGNAGAAAVWLDGKSVHRNLGDGYVILDKHKFEVNLPIGRTPCLVKVARRNWEWGWDWGFAMRVLPPNRAVIEGTISSEKGKSIPNAVVQLEQSGVEITQSQTDASGSYRVSVYPAHRQYDLAVTAGELGSWRLGRRLHNGERRTLNLILKEAISISGTLLMLDDATPHVFVPVQALIDERVIATTLSDENGEYQFINLKPGRYQVRCQVLDGYFYYRTTDDVLRFTFYDSAMGQAVGDILKVEESKSLKGIDFRFPPFKKGTWKSYTYIDGLVNNEILAIYQDPNGAMWIATTGGVSKYDGKGFVNFTTKNGLPSNIVSSIQRDQDGVMWFGTQGGVSRYDGKTFVNFTQEDGLADNWVTSIYAAVDGILWFGTYGGGISRYDGETFINLTPKDGLADNWVLAIYGATDGILWFGTAGGGVSRYDGKEFVNFTTEDGLAHNRVIAIHGSPDGALWFGTHGGGVSWYAGKEFTPLEKEKSKGEFITFTTKDGLPNNYISSIHRDSDGVTWFGTQGGVSRYDGETFVNFTQKLASPTVSVIYRDSNGVMWFGTRWRGLSQYDEKGLVTFTTKDGLAANDVMAFYTAPDGVMWLGSRLGGISKYEGSLTSEGGVRGGKRFVTFTTKDGLPSNKVLSIYRDPDGVMWFGTEGGGVSRYDGEKFVTFTAKDGLPHNKVATICDASDSVLWFGTWGGGVSRYDGKKFVTFTTKDGLPDNSVCCIHHGPERDLWFGTYGGGVSRYDGKEFVTFTTEYGLASNIVWNIYRDPIGDLWFGTLFGGVSCYDGKEFVTLTTEDGLAHNDVLATYRDSDDVLWFATHGGGVSRYDGIAWTSLDTRDGLPSNIVRSIHQDFETAKPTGAKDLERFFWLGTDGGLVRYRLSTTPPSVRIVSVKIDEEYIELDPPPITTGTRVTIRYNAIDLVTVPEKRQYRVRIEGIGDDPKQRGIQNNWRPPTKETFFDYTFKKPGSYAFQVQAIDRDLNYSKPASLTLKVVPPWYKNGWIVFPSAGIVLALLMGCLVYGTRYYVQRRKILAYQRAAVEELLDAQRVQMSLMPETAPEIAGLDIAGKCLPANTVSGDFFDYLEGKQTNEFAVVVGDVTGHGMKGAMNAMMTDGILRMAAEETETLSPASLMMKVNNVLTSSMEREMNVTMVIGMIDSDTKKLTLANAGHHAHPVLLRNGDIRILKMGGFPLGMRAGIQYREEQFSLAIGDIVIFMTDGIIEVQDSEGKLYSDSGRLEKTLLSLRVEQSNPEVMVDAIISDAMNFGGDKSSRDDDMTVVVVKIKNPYREEK